MPGRGRASFLIGRQIVLLVLVVQFDSGIFAYLRMKAQVVEDSRILITEYFFEVIEHLQVRNNLIEGSGVKGPVWIEKEGFEVKP